ncbi:FUSC family protein [Roseococcus sp. YIM B11640]|uniref:FUSC family protein n=1 Tax=Roseococcus sp. YIM B11640 TaxID=3133973 RepID=UPI003C7B75CA
MRALAAWGFDPERLRFGLRTAVTACVALLIAWLAGLEHPQWAAMTVWAASQPTRGLLLEKSLFRTLGTVAGVAYGVGLMWIAGGEPARLVAGLALWIGFSAWAGNLLRGLPGYGTIVMGYSASMVVLLDTAHPDHVWALGLDRFLTVMTGVLVAAAVGMLLTPPDAEEELAGRSRRLTAAVLRDLSAWLRDGEGPSAADRGAVLRGMAAIEEGLDPHGAGSLRSRRSARTIRAILIAQVEALLWLEERERIEGGAAIGRELDVVADAMDARAAPEEVIAGLQRAVALAAGHAGLRATLLTLETAIRERLWRDEPEIRRGPSARLVLHRDWVGAGHAAVRAMATMLAVGGFWLLTDWRMGSLVLLGTSVMISLFSTFENPVWIMRHVLVGQFFGAIAALICRWLAWPLAGDEFGLVLGMIPFMLSGVLPFAHRRSMFAGPDFNMILLLLLTPHYPPSGSLGDSLWAALAVIAGPAVALLAFRFVLPVDPPRRLRRLRAAMAAEIETMAGDADAPRHREVWRARLYHRLLRLLRLGDRAGVTEMRVVEAGLALLGLGHAVMRLREIRSVAPDLEPRAVDAALRRLARLRREPEEAVRALDRVAKRLAPVAGDEAALLATAARRLAAHPEFFRDAGL